MILVPHRRRCSIVRSRIPGHVRNRFDAVAWNVEHFGQRLEYYVLVQIGKVVQKMPRYVPPNPNMHTGCRAMMSVIRKTAKCESSSPLQRERKRYFRPRLTAQKPPPISIEAQCSWRSLANAEPWFERARMCGRDPRVEIPECTSTS